MNQEIDHTLTDEEGNETHAIRFVQREDAVYFSFAETSLNPRKGISNIQVLSMSQECEGIELMVAQNVTEDGTEFALHSRIVISKNDAKHLISKLIHCL